MTQLIQPNLSVVGYPDYCLAYVEGVFGVHNDPDPDAWQGWLDAKLKHYDQPPADVSVPVWFSWTGTIGGVTQNWGHVAVSTPEGVYTNPLSGSGHKVYPSVPALAAAYGVQYVGWSEDLGNLIIVKGVNTMTPTEIDETISYAFNEVTGAGPTDQDFATYRPLIANNNGEGIIQMFKNFDTSNVIKWKNNPDSAKIAQIKAIVG